MKKAASSAHDKAKIGTKQYGDISKAKRDILALSDLQIGDSLSDRQLNLYHMSLTDNIDLVAMSCEPVFGYDIHIQKDGKLSIAVGYADHIYGYLPTDKQLSEGGYEASGFRTNFSLPGSYKENVEKILVSKIKQLIQ